MSYDGVRVDYFGSFRDVYVEIGDLGRQIR
jgi:hypothetical protein